MTSLDVCELRLHLREHALPQRVALRHGVALVRHADTGQPTCPRELERVPDDPMHALVGVDLFLNRDLVRRARLEAPADAGVQPLGVLAKHDEPHVGGAASLQRTQPLVEQDDGPVVDVEVELEAEAEEDVSRVPVVRDARIAHRADEDRVVVTGQPPTLTRRERDAGLKEVIRPVRQRVDLETVAEHIADRVEDLDRLRRDLGADAVAGDERNAHGVQR